MLQICIASAWRSWPSASPPANLSYCLNSFFTSLWSRCSRAVASVRAALALADDFLAALLADDFFADDFLAAVFLAGVFFAAVFLALAMFFLLDSLAKVSRREPLSKQRAAVTSRCARRGGAWIAINRVP